MQTFLEKVKHCSGGLSPYSLISDLNVRDRYDFAEEWFESTDLAIKLMKHLYTTEMGLYLSYWHYNAITFGAACQIYLFNTTASPNWPRLYVEAWLNYPQSNIQYYRLNKFEFYQRLDRQKVFNQNYLRQSYLYCTGVDCDSNFVEAVISHGFIQPIKPQIETGLWNLTLNSLALGPLFKALLI